MKEHGASFGFLVSGLLGSMLLSLPAAADRSTPICAPARVGQIELTDRDVFEAQALVQPTPNRAQAERLLFDAALAHQLRRGYVAGASVRAWLSAYREVIGKLRSEGTDPLSVGRRAQGLLGAARRSWEPAIGTCFSGLKDRWTTEPVDLEAWRETPAQAGLRAEADGQRHTLYRLRQRFLPNGASDPSGVEVDLGWVRTDQLVSEVAKVVEGASVGTLDPIQSRHGVHLVTVEAIR